MPSRYIKFLEVQINQTSNYLQEYIQAWARSHNVWLDAKPEKANQQAPTSSCKELLIGSPRRRDLPSAYPLSSVSFYPPVSGSPATIRITILASSER